MTDSKMNQYKIGVFRRTLIEAIDEMCEWQLPEVAEAVFGKRPANNTPQGTIDYPGDDDPAKEFLYKKVVGMMEGFDE